MRVLFVSSTRTGGSGLSQRQLAARLIGRGHEVRILTDPRDGQRTRRYAYRRQVDFTTKLEGRRIAAPSLAMQRQFGRRAVPASEYDVPVFLSPFPENAYRAVRDEFHPDVVVATSINRTSWRRLRAQLLADRTASVLYLVEEIGLHHLARGDAAPDLLLANSHTLAAGAARAGATDCLVVPSVIETDAARVTSTRRTALVVNPSAVLRGDRALRIAAALFHATVMTVAPSSTTSRCRIGRRAAS